MRHKIKSSLIENSWFQPAIVKTIEMHEAGEDLMLSPLAEFQRNYDTWGGIHMSLIGKTGDSFEAGIKDRLKDFISLYNDIKKHGYKNIAPIFVWFDDDGFIRLYDGHHRLSIIRYLGIDPEVEITTDWDSAGIDPTGIKGRDFPLVEIASSIWGYRRLYHYVNDPLKRLDDFTIQRPDSTERLNYINKNLVGKTVLDIGCSEGFVSHELAKEGYEVIGLEKGYILNEEERGRKLTAIARYLATLQSIKAKFILADWKDIIRQRDAFYDNILYLSVLHNEINNLGYEKALSNLELFRGKSKRLFIEIPDIEVQPDWAYAFSPDKFPIMEKLVGMKLVDIWRGYRPILLFEKQF